MNWMSPWAVLCNFVVGYGVLKDCLLVHYTGKYHLACVKAMSAVHTCSAYGL